MTDTAFGATSGLLRCGVFFQLSKIFVDFFPLNYIIKMMNVT